MTRKKQGIQPAIVLIEPQLAENIGACARAMLNFGYSDLRLVNPRDGWPQPHAKTLSAGALDHFTPEVFDSFDAAVEDLHFILATTARTREMTKPIYSPHSASEKASEYKNLEQKTGYIFGCERTGLRNEEIAKCQGIITIETNADFSSMNLAQAVLLIIYQHFLAHKDEDLETSLFMGLKALEDNKYPTRKDLNTFVERLIEELDERHFFRTQEIKPIMERNIHNIFANYDLTDQELRTLHGIVSALTGKKGRKKAP